MKIIFVSSHLTVFVGYGRFLMEYANKFCEHGHQVTIIAQKINLNSYRLNQSIFLIEVGGFLPSNPLHWFLLNRIKKRYLEVLNKLHSDVLISLNFPANYFCANVNKKNHPKYVYYCFEPYRFFHDKKFYSDALIFQKYATIFLRAFFKKKDIEGTLATNKIICISNFVKNKIGEVYDKDSYVHHIGVDVNLKSIDDFFLENKLPPTERSNPIIFTLGLSHHLKGVKELMLIFHKILKEAPNAILLIGGWILKENEKLMRKLIKKLKIPQNNIIFYGFIKEEGLDSFYKNATLTLYTAIDEAYGYIPIESMKNGTPVIAFEGGPSDTIIDGQTGYVIKKYDLEAFAQKSIRLLQDKNLRERISGNAKLHVKNNFNINKSFSELETILQSTISQK